MLIDLHAHSSGISRCCKIDGKDMVVVTKNSGMDGVILTNHYDKDYITVDAYDLATRYVNEYKYVKECGDQIGFRVFFGIEVTMAKHNNVHMLVYGVDCDFLLKHPNLYDNTIDELSKLVKDNNGILVQAHPLRKGKNVLFDLKYLDGIEANCHPKYDGTYIDYLSKLAYDNSLILTCGGDFHNDTHRVKCGLYLDDNLRDTLEIVNFLISSKSIKLCIQEPDSLVSYDYIFNKGDRK